MAIDYVGVGGATVVSIIIGALWYSPVMFLKPWMLAQGKEYPCPPQKGGGTAILNAAAMSLISALALSEVFTWRQVSNLEDALVTALLMAVGFVVSNQLLRDRFHGATPMLSAINAANTVVTYLAMGLVLQLT
jgi:hypothetical protein